MTAQIQLLDVENTGLAIQLLKDNKQMLLDVGNTFVPNLIKRGGGIKDIYFKVISFDKKKYYGEDIKLKLATSNSMIITYIDVDVCDAMGANILNTISEKLSDKIKEIVNSRILLRILTNYAIKRRAISYFRIPIKNLKYKNFSGKKVAVRLIEAYAFACEDVFRAVTHNKGVMNGIDAVALALGQDVRAIEAGAHAWACRSGGYQPLTQYSIVREGEEICLEGRIDIPMPIGVVGGSINSNPMVNYTFGLLGNPSTSELACLIASVGLAQNFAALRALATEGIQRGHMNLHARNFALQAGVPNDLIEAVVNDMIASGTISLESAKISYNKLIKPKL